MGSDTQRIKLSLKSTETVPFFEALAEGFRHAVLPGALKGFASHIEPCTELQFSMERCAGLAELKLTIKGKRARITVKKRK